VDSTGDGETSLLEETEAMGISEEREKPEYEADERDLDG